MTRERDIERLLDAWFADGPMQVSDRAFDEAVGRVRRQRQRPAWRFLWRKPNVITPFKVALGAAAVIVVLVAGFAWFGRTDSQVGGIVAPTPSLSPTTSPTPVPTPIAMPEGVLHAGTYVVRPLPYDPLRATFTTPEGWRGFSGWAILGPSGTEAPDGTGIAFVTASALVADPCRTVQPSAPQPSAMPIGPTVDDLVAAMVAHGGYTASTPADTVLSGYAGKRLDLQLPADLSGCGDRPSSYSIWQENGGDSLFAQGPGNIWHLQIVDVDGLRLIVVVTDYAATPASVKAEAQSIVDSIVLEP